MQRTIITTADGSKTIHLPEWNEQYHSKHGAILEANHVFIQAGLYHILNTNHSLSKISILEIGFGTGLNAYLTLLEAKKLKTKLNYVGIEAFPVMFKEIEALNYSEIICKNKDDVLFNKLHSVSWESKQRITNFFSLTKKQQFFKDIDAVEAFNLIYFDAFGARVQPELWTQSIFKIMYSALRNNGVLVTYSAKGSVRRVMQSVGFEVERLPGPPGKREMLRASKRA